MRDPARIPKILGRLKKCWEQYPDMRLGQLIIVGVPARFGLDPFNVEDEELMKGIEDVCEGDSDDEPDAGLV